MHFGSEYRARSISGDAALAELGDRQQGMVARWQLGALGLGRGAVTRRIARKQLRPLYRGVFAVGHAQVSIKGQWMAAVLACGPDAVLSHAAAAALRDLRRIPQGQIDITAPGPRKHEGIRCHVSRSLPAPDRTVIDGIPVTGLARTYLDYAEQATPRQLREALEAGQRQNVLDGGALHELIARSRGRRGIKPLTAALAELADVPPWLQSKLERDFRELLLSAGIPSPQFNVYVEGELVDCVWRDRRVVAELDGYDFHRDREQFEDDRRRDVKLQKAGWNVLRFTYRRVDTDPAGVLADVHHMLGL